MRYRDLILTNNDGARVAFRKCRQAIDAEIAALTVFGVDPKDCADIKERLQGRLVDLYHALEQDDLQSREL